MKLSRLLRNKLFFVFSLFLVIYAFFLILFNQHSDLWWDSAVYIGVGEYIFSGGHAGVFQPIVYPLLPLILGALWKIGFTGFNIVYAGKLLIFLASFASLLTLYLITKKLFDSKLGIWATIILFFNTLFFLFMFRVYTEMLSILFALCATLFILKAYENPLGKRRITWLFLAALFCILGFLNKYTNVYVILVLEIFVIFKCVKNRKILDLILFNLLLLILATPFFIINYLLFGDWMHMLTLLKVYLSENMPTVYSLRAFPGIPRLLFENTDFIYLKSVLYLFTVLLPFMLYGIYRIFRNVKDKLYAERVILLIIPAILLFAFVEISYLKQERYLLPIFPLLAIFCAHGLKEFAKLIRRTSFRKILTILILAIYIISSFAFSFVFFSFSYGEMSYENFFINPPVNLSCEKAATADPRSVINSPLMFPYQVFDKDWDISHITSEDPDCIFYFSCYEGRADQISEISSANYTLDYISNNGRCTYAILHH